MTPDRFNECLDQLYWTTETLATVLGCERYLTEAYSLGLEKVPNQLSAWLDTLALVHATADMGRPVGLKGNSYGTDAVREDTGRKTPPAVD